MKFKLFMETSRSIVTGIICLKSSNCTQKQSKTNSPLGKHPHNLVPYGILPTYGIGASRVSPQGQAHQDDVFREKRRRCSISKPGQGHCGLWRLCKHLTSAHDVSCLLTVILSLFLSKMHNILRQPAPRIQEDKPSELDR